MGRVRPQRDVLDRLVVRAPALARAPGEIFLRTRPGSSIRKRLLQVLVDRGFAAMARSDVDLLVTFYEPDTKVWLRGMEGVGITDCYRGHEGIRALFADVDDAWSDWRWNVEGIVDFRAGFAVRGNFVGYGRGSGAETVLNGGGTFFELSRRGRVARQEWFVDPGGWEKAVEEGGSAPGAP